MDTETVPPIRLALAAGYARLAARAELLDRINVFPVADSDTGTNLRAALAPLRDAESSAAQCIEDLQRTAVGNSGNIAAAFFPPLVAAENETALSSALVEGERLARRSVLQPKDGTMLDVFQTLAVCSEDGKAATELLVALAECVRNTQKILPELRTAEVVDSGALGMFLFFEGFLAALTGDTTLIRPVGERFAGLLSPRFLEHGDDEAGHCIQVNLKADIAPEVLAVSLEGQAESVVARQTGGALRLHLHSDDPDALKERLARLGEIGEWRSEVMASGRPDDASVPPAGPVRLLCDAAASLPRDLARRERITLLDSYVLCGGVSKPETLWDQAAVYSALRAGGKAATVTNISPPLWKRPAPASTLPWVRPTPATAPSPGPGRLSTTRKAASSCWTAARPRGDLPSSR